MGTTITQGGPRPRHRPYKHKRPRASHGKKEPLFDPPEGVQKTTSS